MKKWEYKIIYLMVDNLVKGWMMNNRKIDLKTEQLLNELGNDGWELTGIAPIGGGVGGFGAQTSGYTFIFKRQIKTNVEK